MDDERKKAGRITVLPGLEAVRRRPGMYIGVDETGRLTPARLLLAVVDAVAHDTPPPQEIRVLLWRDQAVTVAYDGSPLPIEPVRVPADGVSHPAIYHLFMHLLAGGGPFEHSVCGAILNALSERLVVSTMHDGRRYRVVFSKGMVVELLGCADCDRPLGVTWLTFLPDPTIIEALPLTSSEAEKIAERLRGKAEGARIRVEDHTSEDADWH
jgi:DNA gyrase/topoisomerase IV subunit B